MVAKKVNKKNNKFTIQGPFIVSTAQQEMDDRSMLAVGDICQAEHCRSLDFLPFKCDSCNGTFCSDHRLEPAHACPKAGEHARRELENFRNSPAPNQLKDVDLDQYAQRCCEPSCKVPINHALTTGIYCDRCRRAYCLKHRYESEHNCAKLVPLGHVGSPSPQKEKALAALDRLKAWGMSKRANLPSLPQSKAKKNAAADLAAVSLLKRTAKGDDKLPQEQRVYVFVEASSDTVTAKIPKGNFFYSKEHSVGRILDLAAKSLSVSNVNNRSESEEDKLRVFHVEGGSLLDFKEKLGQKVKNGDTIVLLRGVGAGMASTPDQTN